MAKGLGAFAEGLVTGFTTGKKNKREEEEHELRMAKARDEREMNQEFKALDGQAKPVEGFVLTTPDGTKTVFADEAMAKEAQSAYGGEAKIEPRFLVGGQQFDSKDAADVAADVANSPAAKLRKRADIALKYNRPDMADAYTKNYNNMLEANRRDMQESFLQAQQTGDYGSVIDAYNKRLPNGATAEMLPNQEGGMTLQITKGGQVITQKPFATPDEFWNTMAQQVAQTPDNMLETWKTREGLKMQQKTLDLDTRRTAVAESTGAATVRRIDADVANIPVENALKSRQVGAAETSAGASATNADTARRGLTMPKIFSGVNDKGEVVMSATQPRQDKQGNWHLGILPQQTMTGMEPTRTVGYAPPAKAGEFDALLGGGPQQPLVVDWSKVPPRNIGGLPQSQVPLGRDPRSASGLITPPQR